MKKVMVSQPMTDKSDQEIKAVRSAATEHLEGQGYVVVNSWFREEWNRIQLLPKMPFKNIPIHFLAMSLDAMAQCEAVYFCKGWENSRGCRVEHAAAVAYGLDCIYE